MRNFMVAAALLLATQISAEPLFEYGGKKFDQNNLPDSAKQAMYELDSRYFKQRQETIENDFIFKMYVSELATKKGKSEEAIEKSLLKFSAATDKEIKDFYDKNKARIPYPFEKVKKDIRSLVERENKQGAKKKALAKIFKEKKVKFLLKEPTAPIVAIRDTGFARKGKAGSKVKVVEFADFQCPHCKHAADVFKKVLPSYLAKIEYVYIDYPINPSGVSKLVARGAHCAGKQGKYWEYHYMAFDKQATLSTSAPKNLAKDLQLDEKAWTECYNSKWAADLVENGKKEGERIGVSGTPAIYINGRKANIGHDEAALKAELDKELKRSST